jgi:hypothetical protein
MNVKSATDTATRDETRNATRNETRIATRNATSLSTWDATSEPIVSAIWNVTDAAIFDALKEIGQ